MQLYGSASAEPFFVACFSGEQGSTTAHLRRLPRKGRAGGAYKTLLKHRVQGAARPAMLPSSPSADLSQCAFLRLCFGRAVFCCPFPGELGSTTAHLRRLPRKGRAGGAQNLCSSIACRAQPCQRCSPVLQALIYLSMHFYGSASAEPFFVAPFPENRGARLRISGGCPVRGEPEALIDLCSSIAC